MAIVLGMASVDLREKPCKDVELRKVVAYHKLNKSRVDTNMRHPRLTAYSLMTQICVNRGYTVCRMS